MESSKQARVSSAIRTRALPYSRDLRDSRSGRLSMSDLIQTARCLNVRPAPNCPADEEKGQR
jgi:hypothetical protein